MPEVIRVLVVDDHALHRDGARGILSQHPDIEVVDEADSGEMALALIDRLLPDVVLMDIRLPGVSGIEATRQIRARNPSVRVLMVSAYDDDEYIRGALQAGASGYLCKTAPGRELAKAIRSVASGSTVVEPAVLARLLVVRPSRSSTEGGLSEREQSVLDLLAQGLTNKRVAARLNISARTVERHCESIYAKMAVHSRTEAVISGFASGLLRGRHEEP
ncbi:MAG: response regulator transcription factor [Phycicoccus sp.]|nr:response regulator transcription factor [Phycicoccus sp.]